MTDAEYYADTARKIARNKSREPYVISERLWGLVRSFEEQPPEYRPTSRTDAVVILPRPVAP